VDRIFQSLGGTSYILFSGTTESSDFNVLAPGSHSPDSGKVTFRRNRKARFNDVDSEILELVCHPDLLCQVH
jgi:hypothetical protein